MRTIKKIWKRFDSYTLEAYNPPHVQWVARQR